MICTEQTMLGFTIVWLFGIACGLFIAMGVAIAGPLIYKFVMRSEAAQ